MLLYRPWSRIAGSSAEVARITELLRNSLVRRIRRRTTRSGNVMFSVSKTWLSRGTVIVLVCLGKACFADAPAPLRACSRRIPTTVSRVPWLAGKTDLTNSASVTPRVNTAFCSNDQRPRSQSGWRRAEPPVATRRKRTYRVKSAIRQKRRHKEKHDAIQHCGSEEQTRGGHYFIV